LNFIHPEGQPGEATFDNAVHRVMDFVQYQAHPSIAERSISARQARGQVNIPDYEDIHMTFGEDKSAVFRGRPFYDFIQDMIAQRAGRFPNYSIEVTNPEFAEEKIKDISERAANTILADSLTNAALSLGISPDTLLNAHPDGMGTQVRTPLKKLVDELKEREQWEMVAKFMLDDALRQTDATTKLNTQAFYDLLTQIAACGRVTVSGDRVNIESIPVGNMRWVGGAATYLGTDEALYSFDACDVVGHIEWLSPAQVVARYPYLLGKFANNEEALIEAIQSGWGSAYPSFMPMVYRQEFDGEYVPYGAAPGNYANMRGGMVPVFMQYMVIRFISTVTIACYDASGKKSPQLAELIRNGKTSEIPANAYFEVLNKDSDAPNCVQVPYCKWYECIRANRLLLQCKESPLVPTRAGSPNEIISPYFGLVLPPHFSVPAICRDYFDLYQRCFFLVDKYVNLSGGTALVYDRSKLPDGMDIQQVLADAKAANLVEIDSSQNAHNASQESTTWKHLSQISLSQMNDATAAFNLAMLAKQAARNIIGITSTQPIMDDPAQQKRMPVGSRMERFYLSLLDKLTAECVSRMLAWGKYAWADGSKVKMIGGEEGRQLFERSKQIAMADWAISVTPSYEDAETSDYIKVLAERGAATGMATLPELLTVFKYRNTPGAMEAILKEFSKNAEALAKQAQQETTPEELKIEIEGIKAQTAVIIAKMKEDGMNYRKEAELKANREEMITDVQHREDKTDIQNINRAEELAAKLANQQMLQAQQQRTNG